MSPDDKPWDTGAAEPGFKVYPDSLRKATEDVHAAADKLNDFANIELPNYHLALGDLGLLGGRSGFVEEYTRALDEIAERSRQGAQRLTAAGDALDKAADHYETLDEEDYRRLKKLGQGMGGR